MTYPELPESLFELEEETLVRWRDGGEPFVFYEGPPTANGTSSAARSRIWCAATAPWRGVR